MKRTGRRPVEPAYEAIEMPRNSPAGFITAFFAVVIGFALIWHIWWMVILGLLAAAVTVLVFGWSDDARARNLGRRNRANGTGPGEPRRRPHDDQRRSRANAVPTELAHGRGGGGPAPTRVVVAYGFWIFILSDIVMFSALFAAYAVLSGNTAGGPTGAELFNLRNVFIETMCLLVSSYTCGLGALSAERRQAGALPDLRRPHIRARRGLSVHRGLGICRHGEQGRRALAQRLSVRLLHFGRHARRPRHRRPDLRSSTWWRRSIAKGLRAAVLRRLLCFSLFWHALDIVWVGVMTLVYLMGAASDGR